MGRSQRHKVWRGGFASSGESEAEGTAKEGRFPPTLTSLAPNTILHGVANAVVTLTGTKFDALSVIYFNGAALATTFTNSTTISATFPHAAQVASTKPITVRNGPMFSNAVNFTYT